MKKAVIGWSLGILCFLLALTRLNLDSRTRGRQQLEEAVRRTAVSCYAQEGVYPPSVEYMQTHYGLHYDASAYVIRYEVLAHNLMPEITVLEKLP